MAKRKKSAKATAHNVAADWASLTWHDLERWAGSRSVTRGRSYQCGGHVKQLAISAEGKLLSTVLGGDRYTVSVWLVDKQADGGLESNCTCPVGYRCKHAVATVAEYLVALADERVVPTATADDPRWARLEGGGDADDDFDDDDVEEDEDWDDRESNSAADEAGSPKRRKPSAPAARKAKASQHVDWGRKIEQYIRGKSPAELADLACSLVARFPELQQEFRERIALAEGDIDRLAAQARKEIRAVTSEIGWSNHWSGEGHTPEYAPIQRRLERLLELGHADVVVELGRELIDRGLEQVGQSQDDGDTGTALADCLPVVFEAVKRSSLSAPDQVLFVIDAHLHDDYGVIGEETGELLDADRKPEDWSAVADRLATRLRSTATPTDQDSAEGFTRNYQRDQISGWLLTALERAGRGAELLPIYETEARATGSYERLVTHLISAGRLEDAERWAHEGIAATAAKLPGISAHLAEALADVARQRRRWDIVAAHAALPFFQHPSLHDFEALIAAAKKAKCEEPVRAMALRFLETGNGPVEVQRSAPPDTPVRLSHARRSSAAKSAKSQRAVSESPGTGAAATGVPATVRIDAAWPLPVPDYLIPLMESPRHARPGPHFEVLIDLAIAAKQFEEVLTWYEKLRPSRRQPLGHIGRHYFHDDLSDRVAEAVAASHPERALEIYTQGLESQLPHTGQSAYEQAAAYLRKLRPIYQSLGRSGEWDKLVASIREKHRNRPRFMEVLDSLEERTIVQSQRKSRR